MARSIVPFEVLVSLVPAVRWAVAPVRTPRIIRHCSRCGRARPFASSERFRVNAQARRLDVWLIYRCETCESTFNLTVHTRASPASLGATVERYHQNDPELAWDVAFDARLTRGAGSVEDVPFTVETPPAEAPFAVLLGFERPFRVRLDRVLMAGLGASQSRLQALVESGRIVAADRRALRRSAAPGQVVYVGDDPSAGADERPALGDPGDPVPTPSRSSTGRPTRPASSRSPPVSAPGSTSGSIRST